MIRLAERYAKKGRGFGYNEVTLDGKVIESTETTQCVHCHDTIFLNTHDGYWCSNCDGERCRKPKCRECVPFMRKVERAEAESLARVRLWREADNC